MGATKKKCTFLLEIGNCAKNNFRNYSNYSKGKNTEILEVIILRNLTKINIVFVATNVIYNPIAPIIGIGTDFSKFWVLLGLKEGKGNKNQNEGKKSGPDRDIRP